MTRLKLITAIAFSLTLAACGGGGGDDTAAEKPSDPPEQPTPDQGNDSPGEDTEPTVELATVPQLEGMGELAPPGVPKLN